MAEEAGLAPVSRWALRRVVRQASAGVLAVVAFIAGAHGSAHAWRDAPDVIRCEATTGSGLGGREWEAYVVMLYVSNNLVSQATGETLVAYVTIGTPYNIVHWLWFDEDGEQALVEAPRRLPRRYDCTGMTLAELDAAGRTRRFATVRPD